VRPGAPPSTVTRTTGSPRARNASASRPAFFATTSVGWTVGSPRMPFCRSTTTSAVLGSSVVTGMAVLLGVGEALEQRDGVGELLLLGVGEGGADRADQPALLG